MLNVDILVGTMTGTAQLVAQEIELAFAGPQLGIDVTFMDALDRRVFERPGVFLICTSTYGQGDVPDNAKAFYADLVACRDSLAHVHYGVFAQRIGEVMQHNASGGTLPEDVALEWFPEWVRQVRAALDAAEANAGVAAQATRHAGD
jgi:MioC protein